MYIPPGVMDYPGAAGHYSERGNAYFADLLYQELFGNSTVPGHTQQRWCRRPAWELGEMKMQQVSVELRKAGIEPTSRERIARSAK